MSEEDLVMQDLGVWGIIVISTSPKCPRCGVSWVIVLKVSAMWHSFYLIEFNSSCRNRIPAVYWALGQVWGIGSEQDEVTGHMQ